VNGQEWLEGPEGRRLRDDLSSTWSEDVVKAFDAGRLHPVVTLPIQGVTHSLPDRRAELLELASRLAAADQRDQVPSILGKMTSMEEAHKSSASRHVSLAAAIIAEVDRVSGEVSK